MSLIDLGSIDLGSAVPYTPVAADQEYQLRITKVKVGEKEGKLYIVPSMEIVGEMAAPEVEEFMYVPAAWMEAKQLNNSKLAMKRFLEAVGAPTTGSLDPDSLVGLEGWAILGIKSREYQGQTYENNYVKRWIAPK